ncbi:MAG: adenylyl-sulfate kinase, partial [Desulfurococcales archaeon]|nr:adenylyl-sulfate kinase [Desulfurococcales archaeon]
PKGLYKKALAGEIKHMTGIDDPYEPPENPWLVLDTENQSASENIEILYQRLKEELTEIRLLCEG